MCLSEEEQRPGNLQRREGSREGNNSLYFGNLQIEIDGQHFTVYLTTVFGFHNGKLH